MERITGTHREEEELPEDNVNVLTYVSKLLGKAAAQSMEEIIL